MKYKTAMFVCVVALVIGLSSPVLDFFGHTILADIAVPLAAVIGGYVYIKGVSTERHQMPKPIR